MVRSRLGKVTYAGRALAGFYGVLALISFLAMIRDAEFGRWLADIDGRELARLGVLIFATAAAYLFSKGTTWGYYGLCVVCTCVIAGGILMFGAAWLSGDGIDWRGDLPALVSILLFVGAHAYVLILLLGTAQRITEPALHEGTE